jgi:hypothetical protein
MAPAKTPTVDEALDQSTALIYSPKAPLATTPRGAADPDQVRMDDRAVWACVSSGFSPDKPEVLVHFHGHNYYVTARRTATGSVAARLADWLAGTVDQAVAKAKGVSQGPAGHFYGFDALSSALPHHPLVLLPEDGHHVHDPKIDKKTQQPVLDASGNPVWDGFWCKESAGTLAGATGLDDVVENCLGRLFVLPVVPPGNNYLTKELHLSDMKRLYLTGHSGGGVPLAKALVCNFPLGTPTTACFLDATYNDYRPEIRKFCETWSAKSHLGNGKDDSCLVIVYNPDSKTEPWKTAIVADLKDPKKQVFPVTELTHSTAADLPAVKNALKSNPIVVIHTTTAHEDIPKTFVGLLLENP